jgi:menaquinone-dependent protoporphyrinogen IX oxidase
MTPNDADGPNPRVLFVYFTYTQQSLKVAEAMADVLRARGCDVRMARIELTDSRWQDRFTRFPLRHAWLDVLGMMPAQLRGATGEISIPEDAQDGDYDLVVIGSPTWWIKTSVPIRSYLASDAAGRILRDTRFAAFVCCRRYWGVNLQGVTKLGTKRGGKFVGGIPFPYGGGQIPSLLALISYFAHGEERKRYLGVKIPSTNLAPEYTAQAHGFATGLAEMLATSNGDGLRALDGDRQPATATQEGDRA